MCSSEKEKIYNYGSAVKVKISAPADFFPGTVGDVCGIDRISSKEEAKSYKCELGDWIYNVEFSDGSSIEIPECYLEKDIDRLKYGLGEFVLVKKGVSSDYHPSEVVKIVGYYEISEDFLAKQFDLNEGDFVYRVEPESGKELLIPESYIERKE